MKTNLQIAGNCKETDHDLAPTSKLPLKLGKSQQRSSVGTRSLRTLRPTKDPYRQGSLKDPQKDLMDLYIQSQLLRTSMI